MIFWLALFLLIQTDNPAPPLTFTTQPNGLASVQFQGTEFNFTTYFGNTLVPFASIPGSPAGYVPNCSRAAAGGTVTQNCVFHGDTAFSIAVTYSLVDPYTLNAAITATDTDPVNSIGTLTITTLGLAVPGYAAASSRNTAIDPTNPIAIVDFGAGQAAIWNTAPNPVVPSNTTDVTLVPNCGVPVCNTKINISNLAPGQTKTASFNLRFTADTNIRPALLAPEAYAAYAAAYPSIITWADRRPFVAWFIADHGKASATNPRGYLQDPALKASDPDVFAARILSTADTIITQLKARPIQPQGITIWDLEGQEFVQPTTYIGDPRAFSYGYAPEMDAVSDRLFAKFRDAGFKVGLTLRPQSLNWAAALPPTCSYSTFADYNEYDVVAAAPYQKKFYRCNPDGASFTLVPNANGYQTSYHPTDPDGVTALLMAKVAYAYGRWHTTFYYVDSTVWVGGSPLPSDIFRQLQTAFPDCLFVPEESYSSTASVAMPFEAPAAGNPTITPLSWRYDYPTANTAQFLSNCGGTCWTANLNNYMAGQRIGDIALYGIPSQLGAVQQAAVESMISAARSMASIIGVTDTATGSLYSYRGSPATVYTYPLKMRVYFADTDDDLPASTTYCENGQWQGESTCAFDLTGMARAQIRYYDFTNTLVITNPPQPR